METEIWRETETMATMETETTALNKTIPNYKQKAKIKRETETETSLRQQTHEYETPCVFFYLPLVQFISQYESIISIIKNKEMQNE